MDETGRDLNESRGYIPRVLPSTSSDSVFPFVEVSLSFVSPATWPSDEAESSRSGFGMGLEGDGGGR